MKLHVVYDIALQSTKDVAAGIVSGLRSLGHDCSFSPVQQYTALFMDKYDAERPQDISEQERGLIFGCINKIIGGDLLLYNPETLIVVSGHIMAPQMLQAARERFPGMTLVLYCTESPYMDEQQWEYAPHYDLVLCNEHISVETLKRHTEGRVIYLPHSFDPEIHRPVPWTKECDPPDVFFCGTGFSERIELLDAVDWQGVDLKIVGFWPGAENLSIGKHTTNSVVKNSELPAYYAHSAINLNIHRTTKQWMENSGEEQHVQGALSVGPRVFEVLACGGFLLTDWRQELDDIGLRDGEHLAVFSSPRDLGEKVRHYLAHPEERVRIAANGMAAMRGCDFSSRLQQIVVPEINATKGRC